MTQQSSGGRAPNQALLNAYTYFKDSGQSIRKTAGMFGVHEATLRSRIKNPDLLYSKWGRPTLFTRAEECQLSHHVRNMARLGYGYARWQVLEIAENMMQQTGRSTKPKRDWYYGFVKRFPELSIQKPKKREMSRVVGSSDDNITHYFHELGSILNKYGLKNKPENTWNVDETGLTLDYAPPKILAGKGEKPFVVVSGRGATTTVIVAGSALGETIPPYIIYKGQRLLGCMTQGCLPQARFTTTKNGWSTSETFHDFILNHFMTHVKTRPCILLYDGHSTHITVNLIEEARANDIHMFVLPPHSSHQLQPLDVGVFSPFKAAISTECHKLSHSEFGRKVCRDDLPSLISSAYKSAVTVANLQSAFRKTGIVPFDPDSVITRQDMSSENVTPSSRKERLSVRNIKLLLKDIDDTASTAIQNMNSNKRQYIIPKCGAAITEVEFLQKLKDSSKTPVKRKASSDQKIKKKTQKIDSEKQSSKRKYTKRSAQPTTINAEVIDSQEAGPSDIRRKEWLTFYDSQSEEEDNEDEPCCVCKLFAPNGFGKSGRIEIINWAKCDDCQGWVHLKYCSPIRHVEDGQAFSCPRCINDE